MRRFEQLQLRLPHTDEVRAHALGRNLLDRLDIESERIAIEGQSCRKILHGDPDVVEDGFHRFFSPVVARVTKPSAAVYGSSSRAAIRSTAADHSSGATISPSR